MTVATTPPTPNSARTESHIIRIDRHHVGPDCRIFIIAEAGVNHNGDEERALAMVDAAADAGADAVKFQMFRAVDLTTATASMAEYQQQHERNASQREMLARLELSTNSFGRLACHCAERGVCFLATPFSVKDVSRLATIGSAAVKIASTDLVDVPLLKRACEIAVPIILSTGAADEAEIVDAVDRISEWGGRNRLILMHCVGAYPTPICDANLRAIGTLRRRFGTIVGFSDHTTSTLTGGWAVSAGASVLEKHFTLDANDDGPDHAMSLEPDALTKYVDVVRQAQEALGGGTLHVQPLERDVRRVARKSVVSSRAIPRGECISNESLTTKRAGQGMPPGAIEELLGRSAIIDIPCDTPLTWEMVS